MEATVTQTTDDRLSAAQARFYAAFRNEARLHLEHLAAAHELAEAKAAYAALLNAEVTRRMAGGA